MSIKFSVGDDAPALLAAAELYLTDATDDLAGAILALRQNAALDGQAKAAMLAVRDFKQAFFALMEERNRVEKLRKQVTGAVGAGGLDLDAARDEIGRRLACLRDAGGG